MVTQTVGRKKPPVISIDHSKCVTPMDCTKCLRVCPQAVFHAETVKYERFKEANPKEAGAYKLEARWRYACTGCNVCIGVCPVDALKITFE